jgi:lipopolysaccharide export LptBFGC system permease protein LptF
MEHQPFPPDATRPPESKFPWPLLALGIAAVLLIVTLWVTPRTNKAATAVIDNSMQPSAQVRISGVRISPQEANNLSNVNVYGEATNMGTRSLTQVLVSAMFHDKDGKAFMAQQEPMQRADVKGDKGKDTKDLAEEPLKAGQTVPFRVSYSQIPGNWDGKPPELTVQQVTVRK